MANKKSSNSFYEWKDDSDSPWMNILIGAVILVVILGIGAGVYLNKDTLFGGDEGGDKTADADIPTTEVAEEETDADTDGADDMNSEDDGSAEEIDTSTDTPVPDDSDLNETSADQEEATIEVDAEDADSATDEATSESVEETGDGDTPDPAADEADADEADADEEDDSAPSGRVNLIENVPMRDILSIYAYPNPSVKLFSVLENFSPHVAGRYENWVYVYYFYTEVVMAEDGETVLNRYHDLRDGWIAKGRLRLNDAQFNSLRVLNPDNLPPLPNLEYDEQTDLPFVGLRAVTPVPAGGDNGSASGE